MEPISLMLLGSGLVSSLIGTGTSMFGASGQAKEQKAITQGEQQAEAQRMQAMRLKAHREQLEVVRRNQQARAMALTSATGQGASQGSGLQGGYGQISGDSYTNLQAIHQNLEIGQNLFDINAQISQHKIAMAGYAGISAMGQGFSNLGGSLMGASQAAGKLGQGFGGFSKPTGPGSGVNMGGDLGPFY